MRGFTLFLAIEAVIVGGAFAAGYVVSADQDHFPRPVEDVKSQLLKQIDAIEKQIDKNTAALKVLERQCGR